MKRLIIALFLLSVLTAQSQITDTLFIENDNVKIHTVLTKPNNVDTSKLAIIIAGSGPTDLNGNQPNMKSNCLLYLSDNLVKNGIATVRFDKRAIAGSAYPDFDESKLTIEQYANDVSAIINHYKLGYKDVFVIGHSEGSLIGLISLQNTSVNGFVSIAGVGNTADELLKEQLSSKLPAAYFAQVEVIIDSLKSGYTVSNTPPQLASLFRPSVQPYLISWFKYAPAELIKTINCKSLIMNGTKDIQVKEKEAEKLYASASNSQLVIVENMNHIIKTISGDMQENIASYTNPNLPINSELTNTIVEFIKQ